MRIIIAFSIVLSVVLFPSCSGSRKAQGEVPVTTTDTGSLRKWMQDAGALFDTVLQNRDAWRVQVLLTHVVRDRDGNRRFHEYGFAVDTAEYFYPASTVKFPVAVLALQQLREWKLDRNTMMITESGHPSQTEKYNEPGVADGIPTVANYISKIFLVSDNDAFNRLYELLGQDYINRQLADKGYNGAQVLHRLSVSRTDYENRLANPVRFIDTNGTEKRTVPVRESTWQPVSNHTKIGNGYYEAGELVDGPFDFSYTNNFPLKALHDCMKAVIFPSLVPGSGRFSLGDEDYVFLRQALSQYPHESGLPVYQGIDVADSINKVFAAAAGVGRHNPRFKVYNKSGGAYGFLTEVAFVHDEENDLEFFLSATIYCNSDGILNDDRYDYQATGYPFLRALAKLVREQLGKRAIR